MYNVPRRSRKSGEYDIFAYSNVKDAQTTVVQFFENGGKVGIEYSGTINLDDIIFVTGGPTELCGSFYVDAVSGGQYALSDRDWPQGFTSPVPGDGARVYRVPDDLTFTGQATLADNSSSVNQITYQRIGTRNENEPSDREFVLTLTLYIDDDLAIGKLLGSPSDGVVAETDDEFDIFIMTVSSQSTISGKLLYTTIFDGLKWKSLSVSEQAGKVSYNTIVGNGVAQNRYITSI